MNLSQASMRRPVTTMMVFVSLVMIGLISSRLIPLELFPEFDAPRLFVQIPYPGSTPEEVEREITRPAEEVIATLSGIKSMRSESMEDMAQIQLNFDWGEDTKLKAIELRERLDGIKDQLPADVERIFVGQFSSNDMPIIQMRVSSERDLSGAYELLNRKLKRPIERIEGVSKVELYGVEPQEIRIEMLADRITAYHIDLNQLTRTLQRSNFAVTAGRITDGDRRYVVRPTGDIQELEQLENLVVAEGVRLRDVARIVYGDPILNYGRHLDGKYAIGMNVFKEGGANTVAVADLIMAEFDKIGEDPEMKGINLYFMDNNAEGITSSLTDLLSSGFIGGLLALFILFFFLRRLSTTLIVTLAVPISILVTVGALYFLGLTLNILSMMGLMLAVGMLVDNAVVVTESIHRHQHLDPDHPFEATLKGVKEVALAVTAGTLTTAIVFLPMIVSQADQVTLFLKHVSIAICVALFTSLLISLTVVPLLSARLKPPKVSDTPNLVDRLTERYARSLDWLMHHRWASVLIILLTLGSVAIPAKFVDQEFFPDDQSERELRLFYHLNDTYTLEKVEETVDTIESFLFANKENFEIKSVYSFYQPDFASTTILLTDPDDAIKDMEEIQDSIRTGLPVITIGNPSFSWRQGNGQSEGIRLTLHGESSQRLAELSYDVEALLSRIEGLTDVRSEANRGDQEVHVVVDRERARQYGFSTREIATTVSSAMRGQNLRRFRTEDGEIQVLLQFQDADRQSLSHLENLPIYRDDDRSIRLASLADFSVRRGPRSINREDRSTTIAVTANFKGVTSAEARTLIQKTLSQYQFPQGYSWSYGQRFRHDEESQAIMMMNLLLALVLIYLVMAALFESLIHPLAIWTSIIFAIVGVFWFFLITDTVFSIMAWIGILILIGVVVNNGIVLIDHINHLRSTGLPRTPAIVQAGRERLRPIVMTAATTILGLVPLCIGTTQIGGDGPPYYPMARAIVGGLLFSTLVTLIILPSIYVMLDDLRVWGSKLVQNAKA